MTAEGLRWRITKAVRASDLPAPSRLIMFVLADVADIGTAEIPARFTPSVAVLARETGLSRRTVQEHLNALESAGWIVRTRPLPEEQWAGERVKYRLCLPPGVVQEVHHPPQDVHQGGAGDAPGVAQEMHQGDAGDAPRDRSCSDQGQITKKTASSSSRASRARPDEDPPAARDDVEQVCAHLADWIEKNGSPRPEITKRWRDAARLLIDRDGKTAEQITRAIDWCQNDEFWRANVLSMPKLRAQYEQLRLQAARCRSPTGQLREHGGLMLSERTIADLERRKRFEAMDAAAAAAIEGRTG